LDNLPDHRLEYKGRCLMFRQWVCPLGAMILCLSLLATVTAQTETSSSGFSPQVQAGEGDQTVLTFPIDEILLTGGQPKPTELLPPPTQSQWSSPYSPYNGSPIIQPPAKSAVPATNGTPTAPAASPTGAGCAGPGGGFHPVWERLEVFLRKALFDCHDQSVPSRPLGATVYAPFQLQVAKGIMARMIFYDYDFIAGTDRLNCRGQERLAWIVRMYPHYPSHVVVTPTPWNPPLAQARRMAVVQALQPALGLAPEMVVIGPPFAGELRGTEIEILYLRLLENTKAGGVAGSSGIITGSVGPSTGPSGFAPGGGSSGGAGTPIGQ
jgi:hypothetical protein